MITLEDIARLDGKKAKLDVQLLEHETKPFLLLEGVVVRRGEGFVFAYRDDRAVETQISYVNLFPTNEGVHEYYLACQVKRIDLDDEELRISVGHRDENCYELSDEGVFVADEALTLRGL